MSTHTATVHWTREGAKFTDARYCRKHTWRFDGGATVPASAAPPNVPVPYSDPAAVDPEEALVAAVSSCHMLWFLSIAAKAGYVVDAYEDEAAGTMSLDAAGRRYVAEVVLRPRVAFVGRVPSTDEHLALHHQAHEVCDIANSVRATVRTEVRA